MDHSANTRILAVGLILLLALGIRIAAATKWHRDTLATGQTLRLGDSDSYWILAGHLAHGRPYQYGSPDARIFRAPLYPLALAPFTLWPDDSSGIYAARLMGCVSGTFAVWLVMCLANRLSLLAWGQRSPGAELAAGLFAALYPGAIGMSIVLLSEAIFCPLMLLTLLGWQRAFSDRPSRSVVHLTFGAGMTNALAILARPSWLLFMPLAGLTVLMFSRHRGHHLLVLCSMALGCGLVMTPWWVRNWMITQRLVPTTLQVGASLYDGLHQGASGASDENMEFVNHFIAAQRQKDVELGANKQAGEPEQLDVARYSTFEYRLNASMQRAALDWAGKNISGAIRLGLVKFSRTWSVWPAAGQVGSSGLRWALTLGCFGILAAALAGSWRLRSRRVPGVESVCSSSLRWSLGLCWFPAIYFTLLHMVFVGSIRYREPAVLVLTALAGCVFGLTRSGSVGDRHGSQSFESAGSGIDS